MGRRLLERDVEIALLRELIADAGAGIAHVALIEGAAGIGKTSLVDVAAVLAGDAGCTVLRSCGGSTERDLPFALVRQLFDPLRASVGEPAWEQLLAGAARLAAPALDAVVEPSGGLDRLHSTLHGLYWLVANLTATSPVVLFVDDLQWADPASLRWLTYLGRRVTGLRLLVVLAARPQASEDALLAEAYATADLPIVRPAPLGPEAAGALVQEQLGEHSSAAFGAACHRATGGNPFLLGALTSSMRVAGVRPNDQAAAAVEQFGAHEVARALDRRLRSLPTGATELVEAVAVLGDGVAPGLGAELAGLDTEVAAVAADALRVAEVFTAAADLTFRHPLIRSAAELRLHPAARALAHERAAALLARRGGAPERLAPHLLHADPRAEPAVARTLAAAAAVAVDRGAPETAVRYLRRALAEPPAVDEAAELTYALGLAAMEIRAPDAATLLRAAVEAEADPTARVTRALAAIGGLLPAGEWEEVQRLGRLVLDDPCSAPSADLEAVAWHFGLAAGVTGSIPDAVRRLDALIDAGGATQETEVMRSLVALLTGDDTRARRLLVSSKRASEQTSPDMAAAARILMATWLGETDTAVRICEEIIAVARGSGSLNLLVPFTWVRAEIDMVRGDVLTAEADARLAWDLGRDTGSIVVRAWVGAVLVAALAERGAFEEAEVVIAQAALPAKLPATIASASFLTSRGRLAVLAGRPADGVRELFAVGQVWHDLGIMNPAIASWRPSAVRALLATGELGRAQLLAREEYDLARSPRAIGVARGLCALVEAPDKRVPAMAEAVDMLRGTTASLELAYCLVDLGAALRVAGQVAAAREPLREGMDLADRSGATLLAERARAELVAAGARPRRAAASGVGALTAQERRIAAMAAEGATSRAIAQTLFLTQRTVDTHLGHVYRKLGIHGRADLSRALRPDGSSPST